MIYIIIGVQHFPVSSNIRHYNHNPLLKLPGTITASSTVAITLMMAAITLASTKINEADDPHVLHS